MSTLRGSQNIIYGKIHTQKYGKNPYTHSLQLPAPVTPFLRASLTTISMMKSTMLLLLLLCMHEEEEQRRHDVAFIHSRYRKAFLKRLSSMQRRLRQRRIPRASLLPPSHSAWKAICDSGNDQALITLTGVDFQTFNWYHEKFKMVYDSHSPFVDPNGFIVPIDPNFGGCPRLMTAADCLALCLARPRTRGSKGARRSPLAGGGSGTVRPAV